MFLLQKHKFVKISIIFSVFLILLNITFFIISKYQFPKSVVNHALRRMIIDTKHNIAWCPVGQAARTVWMRGFAELAGLADARTQELASAGRVDWETVARRAFPVDNDTSAISSKLKPTKKFIIVRNPYTRLLAVYRDQFENKSNFDPEWFLPNQPTFQNFLEFITMGNNLELDEQWMPMHAQCLPQYFHYDYIIKVETFSVDNKFMLKELGLELKISNLPENVNEGRIPYNVVEDYYSQLPSFWLDYIYKMYYLDFKTFGYKFSEKKFYILQSIALT